MRNSSQGSQFNLGATPSKGQPDRPDYTTRWFEDGLYWSHGGIEWHKCDPQPHKGQPIDESSVINPDDFKDLKTPKGVEVQHTPKGQPSVDELFTESFYNWLLLNGFDVWVKGSEMTSSSLGNPLTGELDLPKLKTALNAHYLELFIACKPEKKVRMSAEYVNYNTTVDAYNKALERWEANLKQRMEDTK